MDEIEKLRQQSEAVNRKLAAAIEVRKKAWRDNAEKRLSMVGAWLLKARGIPLDGGLDEMPVDFVNNLTPKQRALWEKSWEKKPTEKPQEATKPASLTPTITNTPLAPPAAPQVPSCPKCGKPMRQRTKGASVFWGCSSYPTCTATMSIA